MDGARWGLDRGADRLCVQPGRFVTPGGFGLVPERAGESLRVQVVLPDSPAAQAGVRAGDLISEWAGLPATQPLATLWQAVQGREELTLSVGDPARQRTLRRAIFAPRAP
jgi:S1-C subfamily serine protease